MGHDHPKPVHPEHVEEAAKKLWDLTREIEGRVPWEEAATWARDPYLKKAQLVLETVLPLDEAILRMWLEYINEAIDLI